jgi:hypothetical protein
MPVARLIGVELGEGVIDPRDARAGLPIQIGPPQVQGPDHRVAKLTGAERSSDPI